MRPDIHWIDGDWHGRLAIMARPRSGEWLEDEIAGWKAVGVDTVVCLLEPDEAAELGLGDEAALCRQHGIAFIAFPIADRGVPDSMRDARALAERIAATVEGGASVAVHCRAGIGRSSVIAACAMVCMGHDTRKAFAMIARARGVPVPDTEAQTEWVAAFAAVTP
jgi:protein-tyrosine phosphatase